MWPFPIWWINRVMFRLVILYKNHHLWCNKKLAIVLLLLLLRIRFWPDLKLALVYIRLNGQNEFFVKYGLFIWEFKIRCPKLRNVSTAINNGNLYLDWAFRYPRAFWDSMSILSQTTFSTYYVYVEVAEKLRFSQSLLQSKDLMDRIENCQQRTKMRDDDKFDKKKLLKAFLFRVRQLRYWTLISFCQILF